MQYNMMSSKPIKSTAERTQEILGLRKSRRGRMLFNFIDMLGTLIFFLNFMLSF